MSNCKACNTELNTNQTLGSSNGYEMLKCSACGTVTVDPFPTLEELIEFYQNYEGSVHYQDKKESKIRRAKKRIARLAKISKGKTFLDVGCNYGFTVQAALDLDLNAHGIDVDAVAVNASKEMFGDHYEAIAVEDYAKTGKKADIVYTSEVIEHVPNPDSFVQAIHEILNKDGLLYLTTPDAGHFRVPKDFLQWDHVMPPEHITHFTRKGIKLLLEKHGFKVKKFYFSLKTGIKLIAVKL